MVKLWSYNVYGKGRVMRVLQSSQLLPVFVVPATIVPVPVATV